MDFTIAAFLMQDGLTSGAVYALLGLALVLVFSVTRVIFIPQGEFVAYFKYNSETIFWTEGYTSKASARNAIESILKNGPGAPVEESA